MQLHNHEFMNQTPPCEILDPPLSCTIQKHQALDNNIAMSAFTDGFLLGLCDNSDNAIITKR